MMDSSIYFAGPSTYIYVAIKSHYYLIKILYLYYEKKKKTIRNIHPKWK